MRFFLVFTLLCVCGCVDQLPTIKPGDDTASIDMDVDGNEPDAGEEGDGGFSQDVSVDLPDLLDMVDAAVAINPLQ